MPFLMKYRFAAAKLAANTGVLALVLSVFLPIVGTAPAAYADSAGSGSCAQTFTKSGTGEVSVTSTNGYCYVAFKNTGAADSQTSYLWTRPTNVSAVDLLVIGGGGGGGGRHTGGGGAGAYVETTNFAISSTNSIDVIVGAGGSGGTSVSPYLSLIHI